MEKQIQSILLEIENELQVKEQSIGNILNDIPPIILFLEDGFNKLKVVISNYKYQTTKQEIEFFKYTKPRLFSKLIYYQKIYTIETKRPTSSVSAQKLYLEAEQESIKNFFDKNIEFIQYYRSGKTILDEFYFLRGRHDLNLNLESFYFERDLNFSTNFDFKAAKILANDMLATYLHTELLKLGHESIITEYTNLHKVKETWTDSKIGLIELLYAIQTARCLNQGNIDIKRLTSYFEMVFNIDLGDVYRSFLEIRGRKGTRTLLLDKLKDSLIARMDEADNRY